MSVAYDDDFFTEMDHAASRSAGVIAPLIYDLLKPTSFVDVGGGRGGWSSTLAQQGVEDYLCVDGDYVDRNRLLIPAERFQSADLAAPLQLGRRFDLVICLEVAEHLPARAAAVLIDSLVRHADAILFSAAIPFQGGTDHVNEQWPQHWAKLFLARGYSCFDCVRPKVWNEPQVSWWYKQNTLLYLNDSGLAKLTIDSPVRTSQVDLPPAVVHPDVYLWAVDPHRIRRVPWAMRSLLTSTRASISHRFKALRGTA